MKKLLFVVAGVLFMATVTFAQNTDTTRTQQQESQQSPEQQPAQSYTKDMVKITSTDLPEAVKQTIQL